MNGKELKRIVLLTLFGVMVYTANTVIASLLT